MSDNRTWTSQTLAIDISGIVVIAEPMGNGYQAHVEGNKAGLVTRGDSVYEAVGSFIYRLAVEADGANERREKV